MGKSLQLEYKHDVNEVISDRVCNSQNFRVVLITKSLLDSPSHQFVAMAINSHLSFPLRHKSSSSIYMQRQMPIIYRGLLSMILQLFRLTNFEPVRYKLNDVRLEYASKLIATKCKLLLIHLLCSIFLWLVKEFKTKVLNSYLKENP